MRPCVAVLIVAISLPWNHSLAFGRFTGARIDQIPQLLPGRLEIPERPQLQDLHALSNQDDSTGLQDILRALEVMQDTYFDPFTGTWPTAIDWTSAVIGTHISTTLSSIVSTISTASVLNTCSELLSWQNLIDRYFAQTSLFYFGENAFALRNQAYDDMLWVVLGWLENLKFAELYSQKHWDLSSQAYPAVSSWHGLQFGPLAAHRARIFYDLASSGWDDTLCSGGMTWNPYLTPYKNAITNELFATASIGMYLYHPGDNNTNPYLDSKTARHWNKFSKPHEPSQLENAIQAYKWLKESHMISGAGLYQDGFHITGWHKYPNGSIDTGTGQCDEINRMVYTYNQGVVLTAARGLWIATGARSYLDDGHALISNVIRATGWPHVNEWTWSGLGRGGVLEEFCDHRGYCSQDGQTFKGIFFLHLTEFCRPLWDGEEELAENFAKARAGTESFDEQVYKYHLERCAAYSKWVGHNANAALATKNEDGLFGMWWHIWRRRRVEGVEPSDLPSGAIDHMNPLAGFEELHGQDERRWDPNKRGRGRTVETQSGGLSVLRAKWMWEKHFGAVNNIEL